MTLGWLLAAFLGLWGTNPLPQTEVAVAPLYCFLSDDTISVATVTEVGDLRITAKHALCPGMEVDFLGPEGSDLAIIASGPPPASCKDAEIGEPLTYAGFPGTRKDGSHYGYVARPPELDKGVSALPNVGFSACSNDGTYCEAFDGVTVGSSGWVRPGYSGGAVVSQEDGRLVGIISAVSNDGRATYFIPISQICTALEQIP